LPIRAQLFFGVNPELLPKGAFSGGRKFFACTRRAAEGYIVATALFTILHATIHPSPPYKTPQKIFYRLRICQNNHSFGLFL